MENSDESETQRRPDAALRAIKCRLDEESSVALFIDHHLEELDEAYWMKWAGEERPSRERVLEILQLRPHWNTEAGEHGGVSTFDFTLPGDVTDYVLAVSFDEAGEGSDVAMES